MSQDKPEQGVPEMNHKLDGRPKQPSRWWPFWMGVLLTTMIYMLFHLAAADLRDKGSICVRSLCLVLDHGKG